MRPDAPFSLFRQPGGFEGVGWFTKETNGNGPAAFEFPEPGNAPLHPGPSLTALSAAVEHRDNALSGDSCFLDVPAVALPDLCHPFEESPNTGIPLVGVRIEDAPRHIHAEVVVAQFNDPLDISTVQPFVDPPNNLDVFLGHGDQYRASVVAVAQFGGKISDGR